MLRSTKSKILIGFGGLIVGILLGYLFTSSNNFYMQGVGGKVNTISDEVVKVGFMMPLSGNTAIYGVSVKNAVEMALKEINSDKKVNIELIVEDSKCLSKDATASIKKLISVDKVVAVIGELCSSATLAVASIAESSQVVMITPASTSPKIADAGDYIFRVIPSDALQGVVGSDLVYTLGYREVAILYINNEYGIGLRDVFRNRFNSVDGEIVGEESFEHGATDFGIQLTKIKELDPDVIYLVALPAEAGLILKQADELGMRVQFIGTEGIKDQSVIDVSKEASEGLIITTPKPNDDSNFKSFESSYKGLYKSDPVLFAAEGYDSMNLIGDAIKNSDGSSEGIKNYLYKIKNYKGASGTITFDDKGEVQKPYSYYKVIDGKFEEYSI